MKVTISFELELENEITAQQKMEIIHKVDHFIETLEPVEMVKKTMVAYPFHIHGYSFPLGVDPSLFGRNPTNPWKNTSNPMDKNKKL